MGYNKLSRYEFLERENSELREQVRDLKVKFAASLAGFAMCILLILWSGF